MVGNQKRISFHFRAEGPGNTPSAIEKTDANGQKHRYLQGVSSGLKFDAHGERMTEKAVSSFMRQASSGDLLLYADAHGVESTKDVGILDDARVLENGDWFTEYRLYDETDEVDRASTETASKLWKQVNGLPPYKRPRSKGFSIEGFIPEEPGAMELDVSGRKAINEVKLDGIVVVPRPAYEDSVTSAVYKALDETMPGLPVKTIAGQIRQMVEQGEQSEEYYRQRYLIEDATSDLVRRIMAEEDDGQRRERLEAVFQEHGQMMLDLVLRHPEAFEPDGDMPLARSVNNEERVANLKKALLVSLGDLKTVFKGEMMVNKAMTQEELALVQNVLSLLTQLSQAGAAGGQSAEQPASDVAPSSNKSVKKGADMNPIAAKIMNGEDLSDEEKLSVIAQLGGVVAEEELDTSPDEEIDPEKMALTKTNATASDPAEERAGDGEEPTTDDAVAEVGENMKQILKALPDIIKKAIDPIAEEVKVHSEYLGTLMEGYGLTEDVLKSAADPADKKKVEKAVGAERALTMKDLPDLAAVFNAGANKTEAPDDIGLVESFGVRKSRQEAQEVGALPGVMTGLFGGAAGNGDDDEE